MRLLSPQKTTLPAMHSAGISLVAIAALIAILYYGRAVCITLVVSVLLAFILEPFVQAQLRLRIPRSVGSFVACSFALLLLYLGGLGMYTQIGSLSDELPLFSERINDLVDNVATKFESAEDSAYKLLVPKRFQEREEAASKPTAKLVKRKRKAEPDPEPPAVQEVRIRQERSSIFEWLYSYLGSFYNILLMASFVPFLVYFMLSWRDHMRDRFLHLFEGSNRVVAGNAWSSIAHMARAYVVGNFILGFGLSVLSAGVFFYWQLPYWLLVGFVSGFLSLVPYIGFPLALIAPLISALMVYGTITPYLVIAAIVGFLHLMALNFFYPAVVGARVHLNPLTVTVALMLWGALWGGVGLVLAIPMTAGLKAVFDNIDGLQALGKLLGDEPVVVRQMLPDEMAMAESLPNSPAAAMHQGE